MAKVKGTERPPETKDERADAIHDRLEELKQIRRPWETVWQEVANFVAPRREHMEVWESTTKKTGERMYDGTPLSAAEMMADGLQGYLVSPAFNWFTLGLPQTAALELPGVRQWLQDVQEHLYWVFRVSNFYQAISEFFHDAVTIGTSTLYSEDDPVTGRLVFSTRDTFETYVAEDQYGTVDTVYREYEQPIRNIAQRFGEENLPSAYQDDLIRTPDRKVTVVHAVQPRADRMLGSTGNRDMPFASFYILPESDDNSNWHVISEAGYVQLPYHVWRWKKNTNETYGRSPAQEALVDIQGLNSIGKTMLSATQKSVMPSYNVPYEMRGRVNLGAGGMTYFKDPGRVPFQVSDVVRYPFGADREQNFREIIKQRFKVDFFLMLQSAERQMTATEVMERQGEKAAVLGTAIGRLNSEALDPLFDRVFSMEYRAGRMPPPPAALIELIGAPITIEYIGPLAQAQRKLFESQGSMRALEVMAPMMQMDPNVRDILNFDEIARSLLHTFGVPQEAVRSREEIAALREQRLLAQQQAAAMQQIEALGKAAPGLGKAPEEGSPMDQVNLAAQELPGGAAAGG